MKAREKRVFAPEGQLRIAQRFIAGIRVHQRLSSPGGTTETGRRHRFSRPSGTKVLLAFMTQR